MSWYVATFTSAQVQGMQHMALLSAFADAMVKARGPNDAALFSRAISAPDGIGAEVFFSPGAARIAPHLLAKYAATSCSPPPRPSSGGTSPNPVFDLSLYAGAQSAWELLS
jgi:hypothetical protein